MHKCVRCGNSYGDSDPNILRGCSSCGSIFFLYTSGPSDVSVKQLDAVKEELRAKDTTLENELAKEIEKRKSDDDVGTEAALTGAESGKDIADKLVEWDNMEGEGKTNETAVTKVKTSKLSKATGGKGGKRRKGGKKEVKRISKKDVVQVGTKTTRFHLENAMEKARKGSMGTKYLGPKLQPPCHP